MSLNLPDAGAGLPAAADMYLDLTLKRGGKVKGEALASGHADDIVVQGFTWGVGAAGDAVAGAQAGRRSHRPLVLTKHLDSASTALMSAVATNDEVRTAVLTLRKAGGSQEDYFTLTLEKARIASYDVETGPDGLPRERVAFAFQRIAIDYRTQSATGVLGASHRFTDDLG